MGNYNPNAPVVLGNEFVGIRDARYVPDSVTERGYTTYIEHAVTPVSGAVGIAEIPAATLQNTVEFMSVYKTRFAVESESAKRIVIPCDSLAITGAKITATPSSELAVTNPNDLNFVQWLNGAVFGTDAIGFGFNVDAFLTTLLNKRILGVRLTYTASGDPTELAALQTLIARKANTVESFNYQQGLEGATDLTLNTGYKFVDFGEYNPFWTPGAHGTSGSAIYPWRHSELDLLDNTAAIANRLIVVVSGNTSATATNMPKIGYVALEVTYCTETRTLYGGRRSLATGFPINTPEPGNNYVQLRNTSFSLGATVLNPEEYLITTVHKPLGSYANAQHPPTYAALRELAEISTLNSLAITQPVNPDEYLTRAYTPVVTPGILLQAGGIVVTGTHDYQEQHDFITYGSQAPAQDLARRTSLVAATAYPWVRFYARKSPRTLSDLIVTETALSGGAATARITPAEFDALPEIIDGWKEITLRFGTAITVPASGAAAGTIAWTAPGEGEATAWHVLAENVPTLRGEPTTTYDPPAGNTFELTEFTTAQPRIDAVVMIAQDPPLVSGFTVTAGNVLAVTGVGIDCGVPNDCIATGIGYNLLSWTSLAGCDTFSRTLVDEWGAMETGQDYVLSGGAVPGDYDVIDGVGVQTHTGVNVIRRAVVASTSVDNYMSGRLRVHVNALTQALQFRISPRFIDANNYYALRVNFDVSSFLRIELVKVIASTTTTLTPLTTFYNYASFQWINYAVRMSGTRLEAKVWPENDFEPTNWQVAVDDASHTTGANVAWASVILSGNTNPLPQPMDFDNSFFAPVSIAGGKLQVDRMDAEDGVWQTIVDTSNFCITGARDLEARVGVQNWYRARYLNAGEFAAPWVTGSGTIAAPGVTGAGNGNSVLIFTSNRAPLASLAYVMGWENRPTESFAFPEVDTQTFQRMYNRNFQIAFRPLERGGETFDRTILVQAAAIPIESLANFNSLRDLAWADLPYVCVRDELGNRWYANVIVPSGLVSRNRRLYLANIRVTDVTDTPAPIK